MNEIPLAIQTTFAELIQRSLDAEFDREFSERGTFKKVTRDGRLYWYFQRYTNGQVKQKYVGPISDQALTERVNRFAEIKSDYRQRRELVRALRAARLPAPDTISGAVVDALWRGGFFRLRGVLVGSLAYQCYAGLLGVRLEAMALRTDDVDFAQFWGIAENIDESTLPPLTLLKGVDSTFSAVPTLNDPFVSSSYRNKGGYRVDFLTPNRGSERHQAQPARMRALANTGAQPLRHLDYLIHDPERSVLLHGGGVPVTVPRAERFAVHKLIVAAARENAAKSNKDVLQANSLIMALAAKRPIELGEAVIEARALGKSWAQKLDRGTARLPAITASVLRNAADTAIALAAPAKRKDQAIDDGIDLL